MTETFLTVGVREAAYHIEPATGVWFVSGRHDAGPSRIWVAAQPAEAAAQGPGGSLKPSTC
ncbi:MULTISPECIES: hypothetical protein [unclassified Nocardia]|uniref:hypothetical protein n=1 Tax=Nocardia sp. NPDC019255 TaxID=3154591 RepID=UPI0033F1EE70